MGPFAGTISHRITVKKNISSMDIKENKRGVLLTDFKASSDWDFCRALSDHSGYSFEVKYDDKALSYQAKWKRLLSYFCFPFCLLFLPKDVFVIVSWQQFFGLLYAFYCRLFHVKKTCKVYIMTFIYKPKRGIVGKIYKHFMTYIVQSEYVDKLIVFTKNEVEHYAQTFGVPKDKFFFTPLTISEVKISKCDEALRSEKYVFSTGRSNRDYELLLKIFENSEHSLHIACNTLGSDNTPHNIRIYTNMFGEDMRKHMYNSYCVAIALKDPNISSGQLVFLQAMQMGKPIVCTRCSAVSDYLTDGYNALLVNTESEWEEAIERLYTDCELYDRISKNAYNDYLTKYSSDSMAKSIGLMIKEDMA